MSNDPVIAVAIDGPSASGKSTVARLAAQQLGFHYVDSGALYRGLTWMALRLGVPTGDPARLAEMVQGLDVEARVEAGAVVYHLGGEDPGPQLRGEPVREAVSDVAAVPEVRAFAVARLREAAGCGSLVMEGRDIGTVVFPDTPYKFYLDARPEERARRRHQELVRDEGPGAVDDVLQSLRRRDLKDTTRKTAPLQIALGARVVDTTTMPAEAVAALVVETVRRGAGTA